MSAPSAPLSEHAAKASDFFARMALEAAAGTVDHDEAAGAGKQRIVTSISKPSEQKNGQRITYQPSFLLTLKNRYTDRPAQLPKSGLDCLPSAGPSSHRDRDRAERGPVKLNVRDLEALRQHRYRRSATAAEFMAHLRPTVRAPPGFSPQTERRRAPEAAVSPSATSWRQRDIDGERPGRHTTGHKPSSAPTTPRAFKRDHVGRRADKEGLEEEEDDFDETLLEDDHADDKRSWRRQEPEPTAAASADGAKVWTPRRRQGTINKDQELFSQVKGILNKLSTENFHQLCEKLFALEIPSLECLQGVVGLVFDKATLEPTFCSLYAQLCSDWANKAPKFKEPNTDRDMTFRRALLNKCQEMFEKKKEGEQPVKRVMIGNIIFIGELYRKNLITHKIIHICLSKLMDSVMGAIAKKSGDGSGVPREEDVECLCKLFIIIGRDLDALSSDSRKRMDEYFRALHRIVTNKNLPARIRFLVQDVVEFRQAGWQLKTRKAAK